MTDIAKMIARIKELDKKYIHKSVSLDDLEQILLAGQSPENKQIKIGGYQELALRIVESNKRIGELEAKLGGKVRIEELEKRVALQNVWLESLSQFIGFMKKDAPTCNHTWEKYSGTSATRYYCTQCGVEKDAPAVIELKNWCEKCGGYKYDCECNKQLCGKPEAPAAIDPEDFSDESDPQSDGEPSATEGQGIEDKIDAILEGRNFRTCIKQIRIDIRNDIISLVRSHSLPKDKINTCGCCGGKLVYIRGKHPTHDNREVCPTCCQERLEQINEMSDKNYGKASSALGAERGSK